MWIHWCLIKRELPSEFFLWLEHSQCVASLMSFKQQSCAAALENSVCQSPGKNPQKMIYQFIYWFCGTWDCLLDAAFPTKTGKRTSSKGRLCTVGATPSDSTCCNTSSGSFLHCDQPLICLQRFSATSVNTPVLVQFLVLVLNAKFKYLYSVYFSLYKKINPAFKKKKKSISWTILKPLCFNGIDFVLIPAARYCKQAFQFQNTCDSTVCI